MSGNSSVGREQCTMNHGDPRLELFQHFDEMGRTWDCFHS